MCAFIPLRLSLPPLGRHMLVVGDSVERFVYYSFMRSMGERTHMAHNATVEKHRDFSWESADGSGTKISFLWAPLVDDLAQRVREE